MSADLFLHHILAARGGEGGISQSSKDSDYVINVILVTIIIVLSVFVFVSR